MRKPVIPKKEVRSKVLTVRIKADVLDMLKALKKKTGHSQTALIELLIEHEFRQVKR